MKHLFFLFLFISSNVIYGQNYYSQKELHFSFPNDVPNRAIDILLGNNFYNGAIEVNVIGTYENLNSVGLIRKNFVVGLNPNNYIWNAPISRVMEASGPIINNIYIGDIVWDNAINQYKVTIHHINPQGNIYSIILKQYSANGPNKIEEATLGGIYEVSIPNEYRHDAVSYNGNLSVNGNIRAREIKVEAVNWPDYVFSPSYELKSLTEIEQYIKDHGHLPEVPKADIIEKEGISLGEMNKILLKKVEELTLHLIELNHIVKKQSQEIETLKK